MDTERLDGPIELPSARHSRRGVPMQLARRYEEIQFIGEGGMGTVYRARDPKLGRTVALKLLKETETQSWDRFLGEARAQARIQHEHICRVYEAGEADGEPYIAMQFIDGQSLWKIRDRLTMEQCVYLLKEVALAVHEAHRIGIIHRDLKPENILVEEHDDGSLKPWVMDFGLAREVNAQGQTQTGAVVGTVAYMPPEQARGDIRAMDRRSDVYSLGATLYALLAGRPPFIADHPWNLLLKVGYDEPTTIGKIKKGIPEDLETIIMKCIERDAPRRYDSARALADDLQRFLDGEPIVGKRASWAYVLWKKARKNKLATALLAILFVSTLGVGAMWIRAQRQAAVREKLAQELGEGLKEVELFLRAAYAMPVHDIERERDVVRARLHDIESRMMQVGRAGEGPGHYALGRGHLALGDPELARVHLEKAIAAGYSSPELEYALGRVLGDLFRRAVDETRRITNKEERQKKVAELEKTLRDPALLHLRAATDARIESPRYAEGLIALYEGKNDVAIEKARAAFEQAPWLYEPKKLEADALYSEGSKYRHDAAFDYDKMKGYFEPAAAAYKEARELGSSDPEVYRAECEFWEKFGYAEQAKGNAWNAAYENAVRACSDAVRSSSRDARTRVQRAQATSGWYSLALQSGQDADKAEREALAATEDALKLAPQNAFAWHARGSTLATQASRRNARDGSGSFDEAIAAFLRALEIDPQFGWALNEAAQAYLHQANAARLHGADPREKVDQALKHLDRALHADPTFTLPMYARVRAGIYRLEYEIEHGADAKATLDALSKAVAHIDEQKMTGWLAAYWKAKYLRLRAVHERATGIDPRPTIAAAMNTLKPFVESDQGNAFMLRELGEVQWIEAQHAVDERKHDSSTMNALFGTIGKLKQNTMNLDSALLAAKTEQLAAIMAMQAKQDPEAHFESAMAHVRPVLPETGNEPRGYQMMAELHAQRAIWLDEQGKQPSEDIAAGLQMVDKVVAINPHHAMAHAARGMLLMVRAARAHDAERTRDARAAKEAFDAAFRENPRLAAKYGEYAKRVAF